ncbi:hypothetical protein ABE021_14025 [Sporosarcina gallistercoris]|uniref:hypothetical protein n=1 Tax=Sporosarcina gallistercoris TaxID=2762245 RepID=UPI003D266C4F
MNIKSKPESFTNKALVESQKSSSTQKDSPTIYNQISDKYDVRNATFGEIIEISIALYEAGEISLKEHAVLTFDFEKATNNLKRIAPGHISPDFNMHATSANSSGQRDWISEFGARAAKDFKFSNLIGYQSNTKVFDILERLSR